MVREDEICYHHFTLTFNPEEIKHKFSNVRFILVAGCARRAEANANYLAERLINNIETANRYKVESLTKESSRFSLFKVGPILLANHGMGPASMSISLHELFLMSKQAQIIDKITLIRFGTCGGIGVAPGTVCITNRAFDPLFQEFIELKICLKLIRRTTQVDSRIPNELASIAQRNLNTKELGQYEVRLGATIGTNDFYEEQGRTNGSICEHSLDDKIKFLEKAKEMGVINMEMESNYLAAMCNKLQVKFAIICVALNNRLKDDRVLLKHDEMALFERRLFWIILQFIKEKSIPSTNKTETAGQTAN